MDPKTPSDNDLVRRWQGGDRRAPNVLLARHKPAIEAYFRTRVKGPDSEDLVQETLSKVTRAVHRFEYRSSFRAYLFRIADNTLKDYLRAAYRRPVLESLGETEASRSPAADQTLIELERIRLILACLKSLPADKRHLVDRVHVEELSAREIACQDQIPAGTVRRRLFDARDAMKRYHEANRDSGVHRQVTSDELQALMRP